MGERDGISVDIRWATNDPAFDLITAVAHVEIEMHVNDHGKEMLIRDSAYERLWTPQDFILLARLSGVLEVAGWHGDVRLDQPLDHSPQSERMIVILQKPPEEAVH